MDKLKNELTSANNLLDQLNAGSKALDDMLNSQRSPSDKSGFGFYGASSSPQPREKVNEKKHMEVTSKLHVAPVAQIDAKKVQSIKAVKNHKFILTCHKCHVKGHIRPQCKKLPALHTSQTHLSHSHDCAKFVPICHFCGIKGSH
ncbi:hypothetical protein RHMOL_Rhmol08G0219000 [Rhododendron molle]|uniref:Uncharacterized protein n=1 Tax=Rhododendron molle TaxID=49168 RepID=A0ACC0MRD1_RHOML|nr:hypothetical protein RHMOL_Rhmol08G0219000 [Rhododendron molle]